nr:MAG TPA: hypothetical protein [Caudoviricetes sp.]
MAIIFVCRSLRRWIKGVIFLKNRLKKLWEGVKKMTEKTINMLLKAENKKLAMQLVGVSLIGSGVAGVGLLYLASKM